MEVNPDIELSEKELGMAKLLVESQISRFDPYKYKSEYYNAVYNLIKTKAEKEQISCATENEYASAGNVIDIMAALEASIKAIEEKEKPKRRKKTGKTDTLRVIRYYSN
ncbi:hypothetical protein [Sporomusa aerivorans]|uniref:hypothetical protein n=1 Tax=Sporomusa aerivorans TaxID=204936 RepID=UPI00352B5F61